MLKLLWGVWLLGVLSLPNVAGDDEDDDLWPFVIPAPEDLNLTEADWNQTTGYNVWMPEYNGGDPSKKTFVMMTGGCLPVEDGGSYFFQDAAIAFDVGCEERDLECQCRPVIDIDEWNVFINETLWDPLVHGMHHCSWEIRRILDEHRRGVIDLAGIAAKCDFRHPQIYTEARELGVPIFLLGYNPLTSDDPEYGVPEPDGYIGTDHEFLGQTMARLLKQLKPGGSVYSFIMQWESPSARTVRDSFNDEMQDAPSDREDRATWREVSTYPYQTPYNTSVLCHHMECQMEGLIHKRTVDTMIFLFESPLRNENFTNWVDGYRHRNLTLIAKGTIEQIGILNTGYLQGLVGEIAYEMGTRSVEILVDLYETGKKTLPHDENFVATKLISYSIIPADLDKEFPPEYDSNLLGNLDYVGYIAFAIVVATATVCAVWSIVNRKAMVVRAAQPFFLLVLISGILIFASTIIPLSFDDNGKAESMGERFPVGMCMAQPWLAFTGFTIIFSALFSKTWRVNRLFHSQQNFSRVQISVQDVLAPFVVIFSSNVIVLVCWTVIDPLTYQRLVGDGNDFWNREIESYGACRSDMALAFLIPLAVMNFATLGVACWQALEARNIQSAFSESKYIGYCVASLFQAFLTGFPIVVVVKDDPRAFYLVLTLMIFTLSEGILLLIFLPKIILAHRFSKLSEGEQKRRISEQIVQSASLHGTKASASKMTGSSKMNLAEGVYRITEGDNDDTKEECKDEVVLDETHSGTKSGNTRIDLGREAIIGSSYSDVAAATKKESTAIPVMSSITIDSQMPDDNSLEAEGSRAFATEPTAADHAALAGTSD